MANYMKRGKKWQARISWRDALVSYTKRVSWAL